MTRNLLGGLALETTLAELVARVVDDERPLKVATEPDGLPVTVDGEVTAVRPGTGRVRSTPVSKTTDAVPVWEVLLAPDRGRQALSIANLDNSSSAFYIALTDTPVPPAIGASSVPAIVMLNPGDYWECPGLHVGFVCVLYRTASVTVHLRAAEYL